MEEPPPAIGAHDSRNIKPRIVDLESRRLLIIYSTCIFYAVDKQSFNSSTLQL